MAKPFDFGEVKIDVQSGAGGPAPRPEPETPFRIALLGDFSGRANRGIREIGLSLANRRAVQIDRDNFGQVFAKFAPQIELPIGEGGVTLTLAFRDLDDFHPDRLLERSEMFSKLREVRSRLQNPATFAAAAAELGVSASARAAAPRDEAPRAVPPSVSRLASGSLLEDMIEQTEARAPEVRRSRAPDELQEFVRRVAEPHLVAAADPRQSQVLSLIDRALSAQMSALLHVPDFQQLEAAWRAAYLLVRRIESDSLLRLYLIDVSKDELAGDTSLSRDLRASGLYRMLVEKTVGTPGAETWALIAGNYTFGESREDIELLGRLAKIASAAGAPFLAAGSPRLLGCESLAKTPHPREWHPDRDAEAAAAWAAFRGLPEARSLGLVLPRFVLRLPYGKKTDPAESFDFEEMSQAPAHEDYLWANPAFGAALLLAQSFSDDGWDLRPGTHAEIDGLPLHSFEMDGEAELMPCAEVLLTEEAAERIMESGLMPLVSIKGRDAARLVRFQSVAEPLRALAGRWTN